MMTFVRIPPPNVEVIDLSKRFGAVQAIDHVSVLFRAGRMHALLGENGAGKSTLVKCLVGYHRADSGSILVDQREHAIAYPSAAHALGLGMVYQHFTLVPQMTVAENFVLGRARIPAVVDWAHEAAMLRNFMLAMPFRLDPERRVATLAAGEKQKLEILKQLYLGRRFIVLDEPTSVLTPDEADEVLGEMRRLADAGNLTVVLITHKLREVMQFAQDVTILRAGKVVAQLEVRDASEERLASLMFGQTDASGTTQSPSGTPAAPTRPLPLQGGGAGRGLSSQVGLAETTPSSILPPAGGGGASRTLREGFPADAAPYLEIDDLHAVGDRGTPVLVGASLAVKPGEIVGIAGVSGNGQKELVEILARQRAAERGTIRVGGAPFRGTRAELRERGVALLTEEPLANAAVRSLSVMENLSLRQFDRPPLAAGGWLLKRRAMRPFAEQLIARYGIRTPSPLAPLETLSGGNVQRTVLARELSHEVRLLIMQNPCFGLDAAAVAEIRSQIMAAGNRGAAVLLISEDLDEILELADRVLVMSGGTIVYQTDREHADRYRIGRHMAHAAERASA